MAWKTASPPTAAELSACVECGLCLPHCPTFRLTGDETASPRGRLNAMSAVAAGEASVREAAAILEFCLQCRACEAACPSLVPFGRAMEGARAEIVAARGPGVRGRFAARWVRRRWLMRLLGLLAAVGQRIGAGRWVPGRPGRALRGMRRQPFRGESLLGMTFLPDGQPRGGIGLLAGCVMDPWFPGVHRAVVAVLVAAGYRVVVPESQTCCGALAAHEGMAEDAKRRLRRNRIAFADADVVVADAAGCSAHLAEAGLGVPVEDAVATVSRLLDEGLLPEAPRDGSRVGIQDPCHHRHAQRIFEEPRRILAAAGAEVVEIDRDGLCCGAAGLYGLAHPQTSAELGRRKAEQVETAGVPVVASANPGCEMQLRSHLGAAVRVVHPIEWYAEKALGVGNRPSASA